MNAWPPNPGSTVMTSSRSSALEPRLGGAERRARLERESDARATGAESRSSAARGIAAGLEVHGDLIGARLAERVHQALGPLDHQVHVEERAS